MAAADVTAPDPAGGTGACEEIDVAQPGAAAGPGVDHAGWPTPVRFLDAGRPTAVRTGITPSPDTAPAQCRIVYVDMDAF